MSESGIVKIRGGGEKNNAICFIRMIAMEMIIICHSGSISAFKFFCAFPDFFMVRKQ